MDAHMIWEMIGYCGSLLVVISLLMSNIIRLRLLNSLGSIIFCVYAIAIKSYPTAAMNAALFFINVYYLVRLTKGQRTYTMVEVGPDDKTVSFFTRIYKDDIQKYFKLTEVATLTNPKLFFVYDGMTIAGLFMAEEEGNELIIHYDYTTPQYRDSSVGKYVYKYLGATGYKKLLYKGDNEIHIGYVKSVGFVSENNYYAKEL